MSTTMKHEWWRRQDLRYQEAELYFAEKKVSDLAYQYGTPAFFYSADRIKNNIARIKSALTDAGLGSRSKIYYAMKANRFEPLITMLKLSGICGIDACSPNEVEHAVKCGFTPDEVSFTAGSLSGNDLNRLARIDGLIVNLDSISAIKSWGKLCPGSEIGIRINPAIGSGRSGNEKLQYSGNQTTKFGVYWEQYNEALRVAEEYNLKVVRLHSHNGCGFLNDMLPELDKVFSEIRRFADNTPGLKEINLGGGLGVPHTRDDHPLKLDLWAMMLADHFGDTSLHLAVEPGDYIVKDAGILCMEVTYKEFKRDTLFVGLNGGFNIALEPTAYNLPFKPLAAQINTHEKESVTLTGNINEALDIWYRDIELPPLESGDIVALINAGAYSSSMASNHCLRGEFKEFLLC